MSIFWQFFIVTGCGFLIVRMKSVREVLIKETREANLVSPFPFLHVCIAVLRWANQTTFPTGLTLNFNRFTLPNVEVSSYEDVSLHFKNSISSY